MSVWKKVIGFITCRWMVSSRDNGGPDITIALPEDDDVLAEQDRVLNGEANNDLVVIDKLTKMYDNGKIAVNSLSLGKFQTIHTETQRMPS